VGAETEESLDRLAAWGFDRAQGAAIAAPAPLAEMQRRAA
jgi:EAL domain-containing protein (putative c-di-GMP-specific phosphodiesterase class I)